ARALEDELAGASTHAPHHGAGAGVDLGDLAQRAKRYEEVAVAVEVECVAMRPVHRGAEPVERVEVRDGEMVERTPLEQECAAGAHVLYHRAHDLSVGDATKRGQIHRAYFVAQE